MNTLDTPLGWMFVLIASVFALGLTRTFARHFYPESPGFARRLAAPLSFAALAGACFRGAALPALVLTFALGATMILLSRWNRRNKSGRSAA